MIFRLMIRKIILATVSTMFAVIISDFAYRFYLANELRSLFSSVSYRAVSAPIYRSHSEYGIDHIPGAQSIMIQVENGRIRRRWHQIVNKDGNIGDASLAENWDKASFRIMAFGDSFTSYPSSPASSWTNYVVSALQPKFGNSVSIKNYGNAGFGLMDMIRKAATKLCQEKPSIAIIAFISNDLSRGRKKYNKEAFQVNSKIIYDPAVADIDSPGFNIEIINKKYLAMSKKLLFEQLKTLYRLDRIFLYNRIGHGNAFYGLEVPGLMENLFIKIKDFRKDPLIREDVKKINQTGVPVILAHLPSYAEIRIRRYRLSDQEEALLASLKRLNLEWRYAALIDHIELPDDLDSAFLLPEDLHPSLKGAQMYAKAIADIIIDQY